MKIIIHDLQGLSAEQKETLNARADRIIAADGRYAPCQGCFKCWTKTPASCVMKDSLHQICRVLGEAEDITIITENTYGGFSANVKNLLDRSIGLSTPFSTYRGGQMHHTLRYGKKGSYRVIAYGDINGSECATLRQMTERNAINMGFTDWSFESCEFGEEAGGLV